MGNILLLEDDKSLNRGISFKLKKEGYNVYTAFTIKEAKEIFYNNDLDMIITDIGLPDGNGVDFCGDIRKVSSNSYYNVNSIRPRNRCGYGI
ncbi:response regulator [Terrisporobacter sp.]|uniref:response regulator n=1 Tax=Terrisporobacter sp. TaxID=1965305 RepID=UPI002FCBE180